MKCKSLGFLFNVSNSRTRFLAILQPLVRSLLTISAMSLLGCACANKSCCHPDPVPEIETFTAMTMGSSEKVYPVFVTKTLGLPVLLLHELPGLTPGSLSLGQELSSRGFQTYLPLLFGRYGQNRGIAGYFQMRSTRRWTPYSSKTSGPISIDVAAMIDSISNKHPGEKIIVAGNCLTGVLPLEALTHPQVQTAVICQPAMPFVLPWKKSYRSVWPISDEKYREVAKALRRNSSKQVIFINYVGDRLAPIQRTSHMASRLAEDGFAEQLQLVIAAKSKKEARASVPSSLHDRLHWIPTASDDGHSTITGASPDDRFQFRKTLFQLLQPNSN